MDEQKVMTELKVGMLIVAGILVFSVWMGWL